MSVKVIQERLDSYSCTSEQEEINALKEITQEIALAALSRTGFFKEAAFQGGSALRILYSLDRFSEDLDFILKKPDADFTWEPYFKNLEPEFRAYGMDITMVDRSHADETVKKAFLKDTSLGKVLMLQHKPKNRRMATLKVKFELDTNPPEGGSFETKYGDFPFPFAVTVQDLPTLFAGKTHALLCREYIKGRDWYDFIWYVSRKISPNLSFLADACRQQGPWSHQTAGQKVTVTKKWYLEEMEKKINAVDWDIALQDISRFLKPKDLAPLEIWSKDFFLDRLAKMKSYL